MEYRIIITKDIAHGEVSYRVEKDGVVIVPLTLLRKDAVFAYQSDDVDVVLIPARGGVGGRVTTGVSTGVSTGAPPEGLARTTPAQPTAEDHAREPWQRVAEVTGLLAMRQGPDYVQFRCANTGRLEADWWPGAGRLKIYGLSDGAVGTWTDVHTCDRVVHLLRQA